MTKMDDFVRNNLCDEDKDDYSTFFEVCFLLTDLRFLCVVLLFSLFVIDFQSLNVRACLILVEFCSLEYWWNCV